MGAYDFNFNVAVGETYCPAPERVKAIAALIPAGNFAFAPPATDRAAWDQWRDDPFGQRIQARARELAAQPAPALDNAAFERCLDENSVTEINTLFPLVRERQTVFLVAEAIYATGEFLTVIEADARALGKLGTWIHPGNDLQRKNLRGEEQDNDLASCHNAVAFALTHYLLGDRLSEEFKTYLRRELDRRFFGALRSRVEAGRNLDWWLIVKHNWNAVCLSCYAQAAAAILPGREDRAWWFAFAESLIYNFTDGFADDGLCTEGVSYWSYGVSHYFTLAEILRQGTGGAVDLLDTPKARSIARFPDRAEVQPGIYPAFCDCLLDARPTEWARAWLDNRVDSTPDALAEPHGSDLFADDKLQFADVLLLMMFRIREPRRPLRRKPATALRDFFAPSHFLICRSAPDAPRRFSATFLGGNNGVNHNHNDLGTFVVMLDGKSLIYDPGLEVYSMRTFSAQRYESQLLNSYGHPVPRIGGQLQETGANFRALTLLTEFTDTRDRMVLNLRGAYDVPSLRRLEREFVFDRAGAGRLTITDTVEFSEPTVFESALITPARIQLLPGQVRLGEEDAAIMVDYTGGSAPLVVTQDTINQPPHPVRLAFAPSAPITRGMFRFVITPV
ncbi:MAG: heparinase II/III family protein [Opitutaceae bacterium]|nr:heparinase II/III family protein [Opitutaceae bacterium]